MNAVAPAAVAGGNVETSQRIVDTLLLALAKAIPERIPAASAGTMNNLTIGGIDSRSGLPYTYYETIAGGLGGSPQIHGASGHHAHMTNSLNTPVEALEYAYPFRMVRYAVRENSGGIGLHRGGDGLVREIELLGDAQVTLLADRRETQPWGLAGGKAGATGASLTTVNGKEERLPGKCTRELRAGEPAPDRVAGRRRVGAKETRLNRSWRSCFEAMPRALPPIPSGRLIYRSRIQPSPARFKKVSVYENANQQRLWGS